MKVMVVDDEEDIQSLFKQKFRKEIKAGKLNMAKKLEISLSQKLKIKGNHVILKTD